eukprot:TRINITY_DN2821_c0_g1_i1.p1 TRINITY_DN2821_c0_g1~~TRINITY_DN2821_c0_g1_i1.p1  ORF type:complete len:284 (+),score=50.35 TRINITY_DN2821_c0_g1_i1:59-853(+)
MEAFGVSSFTFRNDNASVDDGQPLAEGFGLTPKLIYAFYTGNDQSDNKRLYSTELCASMLGMSLGTRPTADSSIASALQQWKIADEKEAVTFPESSSDLSASVSSATASLQSAGSEEDTAEKNQKRRRRRGKNKAPVTQIQQQINKALDPVKYKTQLCKNWETEGKCPYGPRCLFAHGVKQLRTVERNGTAINEAENTPSPGTAFYRLGKFPEFMPMPTNMAAPAPVPNEGLPSTPVLRPEEDPVFTSSVICNRLPGYPSMFTW